MSAELVHHPHYAPSYGTSTVDLSRAGVLRFPTDACAHSCPTCRDCGNDCLDCDLCEREACPHCAVPDLTPRTAVMLVLAGETLGTQVRQTMLGSGRPVLLHHLAGAFGTMTRALERGERPVPSCMAEQLCLHFMISYATDLACDVGEVFCTRLPLSDYDYYFHRLYDTLLPDDDHFNLVMNTERRARADRIVDFEALADVISTGPVHTLFAPFS